MSRCASQRGQGTTLSKGHVRQKKIMITCSWVGRSPAEPKHRSASNFPRKLHSNPNEVKLAACLVPTFDFRSIPLRYAIESGCCAAADRSYTYLALLLLPNKL